MKKSLYILICFCLFASDSLLGLTVENLLNFNLIHRAVIYAIVLDISADNAPYNTIEIEYQNNTIVLEDKWTINDVGEFTPTDTIEIGKSYLFYIEKSTIPDYAVVENISQTNDTISPFTKRSKYYFKVYNMIGNKMLPLSKCKLDSDFINLIIDGGDEMKLEGFVQ